MLHLAKLTDGVWGSEFDPTSTSAPKNGTVFRYDATAKQYVYNLNTKVLAAGTYRLRIDLGHGGELFAQIPGEVERANRTAEQGGAMYDGGV